MKDIVTIIVAERRALINGLMISFLLILPFTFLPAIIKNGLSVSTFTERFNDSILYSFGFALIVIIAAVVHNYHGLVTRKWYFEKPAFKDLDFYGRIDGVASVSRDLETLLLGKIGKYFFRLNLIDTDKRKSILEIVPLIDQTNKEKAIEKLKREYDFQSDFFFGVKVRLNEIDLDDPQVIRKILIDLAEVLEKLDFVSLEVDENELEMDLKDR